MCSAAVCRFGLGLVWFFPKDALINLSIYLSICITDPLDSIGTELTCEKTPPKQLKVSQRCGPFCTETPNGGGWSGGVGRGRLGAHSPLEAKNTHKKTTHTKKRPPKKKERRKKKSPQTSPTPQSCVSIWKAVSLYKDLKCCKTVVILSDKGCWREGNQMDSGF